MKNVSVKCSNQIAPLLWNYEYSAVCKKNRRKSKSPVELGVPERLIQKDTAKPDSSCLILNKPKDDNSLKTKWSDKRTVTNIK